MQDAPLMQVLESGKDLPKVAHLWLQQGVPGLPDVGQDCRDEASAPRPPSPTLPRVCSPRKNKALTLGLKVPTSSPTPSTIPHLSAAELQENVYVVSILKVVRETHDVAVLQAAVQLNLV